MNKYFKRVNEVVYFFKMLSFLLCIGVINITPETVALPHAGAILRAEIIGIWIVLYLNQGTVWKCLITADLHWVLTIVPRNSTWHPYFQQAIFIRAFSVLSILQMKETEAESKLPQLHNCRARMGIQEARKQLVPFTITRSANLIIRKGHWWEQPRKRKSMRPGVSRKWLRDARSEVTNMS